MLSSFDNQKPLYISPAELNPRSIPATLGFLELTTDEQIAKKIYEATGDLSFKGFLPMTWKTENIVKMRDLRQRLIAARKPVTAQNMAMQLPSISQAAHQYFITNADKIRGIIPENPTDILKPLNPLLIVAGLAAAAFIIAQVAPLIPKAKK